MNKERKYSSVTENSSISDSWKKAEKKPLEKECFGKQELYDNFGEHLLNKQHPVLQQFLQKEAGLYEEILTSLKKQDSEKSKERQKEIKQKLQLIYQGLEWFQT